MLLFRRFLLLTLFLPVFLVSENLSLKILVFLSYGLFTVGQLLTLNTVSTSRNTFVFNVKSLGGLMLFIFLMYIFLKFDYVFSMVTNIVNGTWREWAYDNAIKRYNSNHDYGIYFQLGTSMFFVLSWLLPLVKRKNVLIYVIYIFTLLVEISGLAKLSVIVGFIFLIFGYTLRQSSNVKWKMMWRYSLMLLLVGFIFLFIIQFLRVSHEDGALRTVLFKKIPVYTLAHYYALDIWYSSAELVMPSSFNYFTFTSFYKLFGDTMRQGMFEFTLTDYGKTNVYTLFRVLLLDYGLFLTPMFFLFLGVCSGIFVNKKLNSISFLCGIFSFLLIFFPFNSLYTFTTVLLANFLILIIFKWKIS